MANTECSYRQVIEEKEITTKRISDLPENVYKNAAGWCGFLNAPCKYPQLGERNCPIANRTEHVVIPGLPTVF